MLYVDNGDGSTPFINSHLQYDGFSIPIVVDAAVTAGATYEVKLVIADTGDPYWDSAIFLKWISSSNFANDADIEIDLAVDNDTPTAGDTVTFTLDITNTGQDAATGAQVDFPLPAGFAWVSDTSGGNYNPSTGVWSVPGSLAGTGGSQSIDIVAMAGGSGPVDAFAELSVLAANDVDSTPGNGVAPTPAEDDEAVVALSVTPGAPICSAVPVTTIGTAYVNGANEYVLTDNLNDQAGFVWSNETIDLTQAFDIELAIYVGDRVGIDPGTGLDAGADGLSFILQNDPRGTAAQGTVGGGMGVDGQPNIGTPETRVAPSLTVEFDTFDNSTFGSTGDIAADHTGVYLDGDVSLPDPANTLLAATPIGTGGEIEDGNYHLVRFVWDPATQTFSYYFDGALAGVFNRDLITYFSSPFATFGFSAATGASRNEHKACWTRPPTLVPPVLADLSLDIAIAPSTPVAGQPATFSVFVTNDGPDAATNVEVTSLLPTGLSYVDDSSGGRVGSAADYDLTTGLWSVGTLASGETRKIDISVDVSGAMPIELRAEVSAANEPDPDSIPGTGATNGVDADDGLDADAAAIDDDEAVISFTALAAGIGLSGQVFFDTGTGPVATAHDGLIEGDEAGAGDVTGQLVNSSTGDVIDTAKTDGSGGYAFSVPSTLAGTDVTVRIVPPADARNISSAVANMTDASTLDGAASATLAIGTSLAADFGLAPASRLVEGQSVTVTPGGVAQIAHTFTAGTAMDVDVSISGLDTSSPGSFTTTLWRDDDCSGDVSGAEAVLSGTQSLAAGEVVCLVARVEASGGLASGATVSFDVMADAVLSGTAETEQLSNADRVTVNDGASLTLTKQVCNASQSTCNAATGAGFGTNNRGAPGEQLVYRLVFENPTGEPLDDVRVYDRTPDYSATIAGGASIVAQPSSVSCSLVQPASPVPAGFEGVVEWNCPGQMAAGDRGVASFTVEIAE